MDVDLRLGLRLLLRVRVWTDVRRQLLRLMDEARLALDVLVLVGHLLLLVLSAIRGFRTRLGERLVVGCRSFLLLRTVDRLRVPKRAVVGDGSLQTLLVVQRVLASPGVVCHRKGDR